LTRTIRKSRSTNPNPNGAFAISVSSRVSVSADSRSTARRAEYDASFVVDVRCGADPLDDRAVVVTDRETAECVPAILTVEPPDPVVELVGRLRSRRVFPRIPRPFGVVGVNQGTQSHP
jgi:hypothetical protein